MIKSKLTRIRTRAYSVAKNSKGAFLFGFATASDPWQAVEYAPDGSVVRTLATLDVVGYGVVERPTGFNACCVRGDGDIARGSLAWRDGDRIRVWSIAENALYEHVVAEGHVASPPVFGAGALYWFELPAAETLTWTLMQSRASLSNPHPVGTAEPDPLGFGFVFEWHPPKLIAHTGSSVLGAAFWKTLDSEERVATVQIPLGLPSETAPEHDALGREDEHGRAIPRPHDGKAYGAVLGTDEDGGGSSLVRLDADPEAVTAAYWPTSGTWRIHDTKNGDAFDGRGLIYGEDDGTKKVLIAPIDGPHVEPEHVIEPQNIDGQAPDLIFLGA